MMPEKIGSIATYTVKEGLYDTQLIRDAFTKAGLPLEYVPNAGDETNAFKMACSIVERRWKKRYDKMGNEVRIKIASVQDSESVSVRTIVQESVRAKDDSDGYASNIFKGNVFKMVLKKTMNPPQIDVYTPDGLTPAELMANGTWADGIDYGLMVQEIMDVRSELIGGKTYAANIRRMIVDVLTKHCGARSFFGKGGVYFIHTNYYDRLALLSDTLESINVGQVMHASMYDENGLKAKAAQYFSENFVEEIQSLIDDIDTKNGMNKNKHERISRELSWFESLAQGYAADGLANLSVVKNELVKAKLALVSSLQASQTKKMRAEQAKIRRDNDREKVASPSLSGGSSGFDFF